MLNSEPPASNCISTEGWMQSPREISGSYLSGSTLTWGGSA